MATDIHKAEIASLEANAAAYRVLPARDKLAHLIAALQRAYEGTEAGEADAAFVEIFGAAPEPPSDREVEVRIRQCLAGYGFRHLLTRESESD